MRRRRFLRLAAAFACLPRFAEAATWQGVAFGADVSVTLHGPRPETDAAHAAIQDDLRRIEALFSLYDPASALSRLNATGRLDPPPAFAALMAEADRAHSLTGGLFDPTVQPLWRALAERREPAAARALIGWHRITQTPAIALDRGQQLTFNGIAQGFATDLVRDSLAARGFGHALVDIGEQAALGGPFRLGLMDPAQGLVGTRTITGTAIATSSPGAMRLGPETHILGPMGQRPLWSTVSIEADSATQADALSTAAVFMDRDRLTRLKTEAGLRRITILDDAGRLSTI